MSDKAISDRAVLDGFHDCWEELEEDGQSPSAPEICRDRPDLIEIFLAERRWLKEEFDDLFPPGDPPDMADTPLEVEHIGGFCGGRYRIKRVHSQGGLGVVFVADDLELGREVAVKGIHPSVAWRSDFRQQFEREAMITGQLEHPGVVPAYGYGRDEQGNPYYAMRFIRGEELTDAIRRFHHPGQAASAVAAATTIPAGEASEETKPDVEETRPRVTARAPASQGSVEFRKLLADFLVVCRTVAFAHSHGIVHRDLKPRNIMLGKYGEVLVVDWGLAKQLSSDAGPQQADDTIFVRRPGDAARTNPGEIKGSPAYMSPEQADHRLGAVGPASDIYSLGATLYHLIVGRGPFEGSSTPEALARLARGDFARPRQANPAVDPALEAICLQAMKTQPADRYAAATDLADDIERYLADEPVSARREPWLARVRRWLKRHRTLATGAAAALAVGLAAVSVAAGLLAKANERLNAKNEELEAALYRNQFLLAYDAWEDLDIEQAEQLLDACNPALRSFEWHYLKRQLHGQQRVIPNRSTGLLGLVISHDGLLAATVGHDDATVRVMDLESGTIRHVLQGHSAPVRSAIFSPDGTQLATVGHDKKIVFWSAKEGTLSRELKFSEEVLSAVYSHDGKNLITARQKQLQGLPLARTGLVIETWSLDSGQLVAGPVHINRQQFGKAALSPDGRRLAVCSPAPDSGSASLTDVWMVDATTGFEMFRLQGHTARVTDVAFDPLGHYIVTGGQDRTVRIWGTNTGQSLHTLPLHAAEVHAIAISRDGKRLASAGKDRGIHIWGMPDGNRIATHRGHRLTIVDLEFLPDGRLVSIDVDGSLSVWPAETKAVAIARGAFGPTRALSVSRDGKLIASTHLDAQASVRLTDLTNGGKREELPGPYLGVALSPDGRRLIAIGPRGADIWSVPDRSKVLSLEQSLASGPLVFNQAGDRIATLSADELRALIIDAWSGDTVLEIAGDSQRIIAMAFSGDGKRLVTATADGRITFSDTASGRIRQVLERPHVGSCLAISADDRYLAATSSQPGEAYLWDRVTGQWRTIRGHAAKVMSLAFSAESRRLATASADRTVKIWDVASAQPLLTFANGQYPLNVVAFSSVGGHLAAGGGELPDGELLLWNGSPGE
jgi:WD40 repeat protein/serine/threonine protein kinase